MYKSPAQNSVSFQNCSYDYACDSKFTLTKIDIILNSPLQKLTLFGPSEALQLPPEAPSRQMSGDHTLQTSATHGFHEASTGNLFLDFGTSQLGSALFSIMKQFSSCGPQCRGLPWTILESFWCRLGVFLGSIFQPIMVRITVEKINDRKKIRPYIYI